MFAPSPLPRALLAQLSVMYADSMILVYGPCGLMDKALVFGTKDCRFESCQGHCFLHFSLARLGYAHNASCTLV